MPGDTLTTASTLKCPHGGTVTIISANATSKAGGAPIATASDTFTIAGCPFQLPTTPPTPSPCVTVRWIVTDMRVRAEGKPTLSSSSKGLCFSALQAPQGPVNIAGTQKKVKSK
jgi:hypothetical protein